MDPEFGFLLSPLDWIGALFGSLVSDSLSSLLAFLSHSFYPHSLTPFVELGFRGIQYG